MGALVRVLKKIRKRKVGWKRIFRKPGLQFASPSPGPAGRDEVLRGSFAEVKGSGCQFWASGTGAVMDD